MHSSSSSHPIKSWEEGSDYVASRTFVNPEEEREAKKEERKTKLPVSIEANKGKEAKGLKK